MFTPKPKNLTQFVIDMSAQQSAHTWMADDPNRKARFATGVNGKSLLDRRLQDANRSYIREFHASHVAQIATTMRGDVVAETHKRFENHQARFSDQTPESKSTPQIPSRPSHTLKEPLSKPRDFYPQLRPKI